MAHAHYHAIPALRRFMTLRRAWALISGGGVTALGVALFVVIGTYTASGSMVQAQAQVEAAAARSREAESGLKDAVDSFQKNLEGMSQTKRAGNLILLVIRPQEVVAAVQALEAPLAR